jgi:hypothetical protein
LNVVAILDWEYGGFYPPEHEVAFYESSDFSGIQAMSAAFQPVMHNIVEFWKRSENHVAGEASTADGT